MSYPVNLPQEKAFPSHYAVCPLGLKKAEDSSNSKQNCTLFDCEHRHDNKTQIESHYEKRLQYKAGDDLKLLEVLQLLKSFGQPKTDRICDDLLKDFQDIFLTAMEAEQLSLKTDPDTVHDNQASFYKKKSQEDGITFSIPLWLDDTPVLGQIARLIFYNFQNLIGFLTSTYSISKNAIFGCRYKNHNKKQGD